MANKEHFQILQRGIEFWNEWRLKPSTGKPDLSDIDFNDPLLFDIFGTIGTTFPEINSSGKYMQTDFQPCLVLAGINFNCVNLSRAKLNCAFGMPGFNMNPVPTTFRGANLTDANLTGAWLVDASFSYADLTRTNLSGARLYNADFNGAILDGTDFRFACIGATSFSATDLSTVKGLDTLEHNGPSSIGVDTIYYSKGNIPEAFLRGVGLSDGFITYAGSLTTEAIKFYSCFISYSSKNQDFVERLHANLQSQGVRCWFAPTDLKIGEKIRVRIDESIRVHEKLLLVLSKHSILSQYVEQEVETALEQERTQKRTILFPIRIDDAVMKAKSGWPALVRKTHNIGDFRHWNHHDLYQKAFDRLLRDLRANDL